MKITATVKKITGSHTSNTIKSLSEETFEEWDISNSIISITTDNAPNMVSAVKSMNLQHIPCAAHTLHLIIKESLKFIQPLIEKCRKIVGYFSRSVSAREKLEKLETIYGLKILMPIQDIETRWNSTYYMIKRLNIKLK